MEVFPPDCDLVIWMHMRCITHVTIILRNIIRVNRIYYHFV